MKIRVITEFYEYQGLYKDSVHEVERYDKREGDIMVAQFSSNGKVWELKYYDFEVVSDETPLTLPTEKKGPIKSDGGSSSYYDLELPESLLNSLIERQKQGKTFVKTEELISVLFGNDYDFGCAFKALVRAKQNLEGVGKAGNDLRYETTKLRYYAEKIFEQGEKN